MLDLSNFEFLYNICVDVKSHETSVCKFVTTQSDRQLEPSGAGGTGGHINTLPRRVTHGHLTLEA